VVEDALAAASGQVAKQLVNMLLHGSDLERTTLTWMLHTHKAGDTARFASGPAAARALLPLVEGGLRDGLARDGSAAEIGAKVVKLRGLLMAALVSDHMALWRPPGSKSLDILVLADGGGSDGIQLALKYHKCLLQDDSIIGTVWGSDYSVATNAFAAALPTTSAAFTCVRGSTSLLRCCGATPTSGTLSTLELSRLLTLDPPKRSDVIFMASGLCYCSADVCQGGKSCAALTATDLSDKKFLIDVFKVLRVPGVAYLHGMIGGLNDLTAFRGQDRVASGKAWVAAASSLVKELNAIAGGTIIISSVTIDVPQVGTLFAGLKMIKLKETAFKVTKTSTALTVEAP